MSVQIQIIFCVIFIVIAKSLKVKNLKENDLMILEEGQPFDLSCITDEDFSHCLWIHEKTNSKCSIFAEQETGPCPYMNFTTSYTDIRIWAYRQVHI